jgi:hypothetical protein
MSSPINLYYIRAAIQGATGIRLSLSKTRQYLIEEGLISRAEADAEAQEFRGYNEFYWNDGGSGDVIPEDPQEIKDDIDRALRIMENEI